MKIIRIAPLLLLLVSCNSGNNTKNTAGATEENKAETTENPQAGEEVVERLPDTKFPSVEALTYTVEVVDTSIDGKLESLENLYTAPGSVLAFRKGLKRQAEYTGGTDNTPTELSVAWKFNTAIDQVSPGQRSWGGGTGWTGQDLYVEWPDTVAEKFRKGGLVNDNFNGKELIFASLCGKMYFLNPDNGEPTRDAIDVGNPIKGTPSIDPTFNGNVYVGQGIAHRRPFGALVVDLFSNTVSDFFPEDRNAQRRWGAYDSSPIRVGQFLFRPGENGSPPSLCRSLQEIHHLRCEYQSWQA